GEADAMRGDGGVEAALLRSAVAEIGQDVCDLGFGCVRGVPAELPIRNLALLLRGRVELPRPILRHAGPTRCEGTACTLEVVSYLRADDRHGPLEGGAQGCLSGEAPVEEGGKLRRDLVVDVSL